MNLEEGGRAEVEEASELGVMGLGVAGSELEGVADGTATGVQWVVLAAVDDMTHKSVQTRLTSILLRCHTTQSTLTAERLTELDRSSLESREGDVEADVFFLSDFFGTWLKANFRFRNFQTLNLQNFCALEKS